MTRFYVGEHLLLYLNSLVSMFIEICSVFKEEDPNKIEVMAGKKNMTVAASSKGTQKRRKMEA